MPLFSNGFNELERRVHDLETEVAQLRQAIQALDEASGPGQAPARSAAAPGPASEPSGYPEPVGNWTRLADPAWSDDARRLKAEGRKIDAVKLVLDHTNWDLKKAKDYVDHL